MLVRPLLLLRIALIKENKLNYRSLFTLVLVLALLGLAAVWLWQIGLDLVRNSQLAWRIGGGFLLLAAALLMLSVAGLVYWESQQLWSLF
jgi:hypothetical protein